jgi:hypothetical protein
VVVITKYTYQGISLHRVSWALVTAAPYRSLTAHLQVLFQLLSESKVIWKKNFSGITDFEKFLPSVIYHMSEVDFFIATNTGFIKLRISLRKIFMRK